MKYDVCRLWITGMRKKNRSWEEIENGLFNFNNIEEFLHNQVDMNLWPDEITVNIWLQIINSMKETERNAIEAIERGERVAVLVNEDIVNDIRVPLEPKSAWQLYKNNLLNEGWQKEAVEEIEAATVGTLKNLSTKTKESGPIKGLVIGHVQSGKTANMAGLMAMAADYGWNFFVVLSGTIENLRSQTQKRLLKDLDHPGNLFWRGDLEHLSDKSTPGNRIIDLNLQNGSKNRYFTVCLKNATRLNNLIEWMQYDSNKYQQLKLLVIDDEADQASINTSKSENEERAKINKLIVNLVEGNKPTGEPFNSKVEAMNYISYTATPYANFLNESSTESLYPKDFIRTLKTSKEYFGPNQVFGVPGSEYETGLNILRSISDEDLQIIKEIHNGQEVYLPKSFQDAIVWFICSVAAMRLNGHKKPISMLVHTSSSQKHHDEIYNCIFKWLHNQKVSMRKFLNYCKVLWNEEMNKFSKKHFREQYPDYARDDNSIPDYADFSEMKPYIHEIINEISHIKLDEDESSKLSYHKGIHICVDNCSNNKITAENEHVRLAYPENELKYASAFIVIGGSTLSRGLTIEGLVSTYFLRASHQADSLMQMGRWFGYRKNYELLPRIWMTKATLEKFEFLAELEYELRDNLLQYMYVGAKPSEYGPRIKNTPKLSWMRITAKNKMKNAITTDMDFTGTNSQTVIFANDEKILKKNLLITEKFLANLPEPKVSPLENSLVWRNIDFNLISKEFLNEFTFHPKSRVFNDMNTFNEWMKSVTQDQALSNWNIVVAGTGKVKTNDSGWKIGDYLVGKVQRSRKKYRSIDEDIINLGVLRGPVDLYADIDRELSSAEKAKLNKITKNAEVQKIRMEEGLEKTPQLIIYRVDSESQNNANKEARQDLGAKFDIIGISILVPGLKKGMNYAKSLTVKIEDIPEEKKGDINED